MFGKKAAEVLIVGAGPVGMFTALLLAKKGITVQIIDKERQKAGRSYALGLHPASIQLFQELDLLEPVINKSYPVHTIGLYDHQQKLDEINLTKIRIKDSFLAIMPQAILERILEEALLEHGVKVLWSHRLSSIDQQKDHVSVEINKLEKESVGYSVSHTEWIVSKTIKMDVPFVIGADGSRSFVRRQLNIDFDRVGDSQNYGVIEFYTNVDLKNESKLIFNDQSADVLWPLSNELCRWSFQLPDVLITDDHREKDRLQISIGPGRFPWLAEDNLQKLLNTRAPWFEGTMEDQYWGIEVCFERRLASAYGKNRIWLVGDSAHLTDPVGLQSMNVGFCEAKDLALTLMEILNGNASLEQLNDYNHKWTTEWKRLQGLKGGLRKGPDTSEWIANHAKRLVSCLPGYGNDLKEMAQQVKLELYAD